MLGNRRHLQGNADLKVPAALILFILGKAWAHEHHEDNIPEGQTVSADPIDSILWTHIIVQTVAWGVIFPTGMVLGLVKSRWHIPVQILGIIGAIVGYFLGHAHGGRQFGHNAHSAFAKYLQWYLFLQILIGVYLRLHIERGPLAVLSRIRPWLRRYHGFIGKGLPIAIWVQLLLGGITALGFCQGDHLGQCLAHFIMGSAFIAYGILLTVLLLVGQAWLIRTGRSQEFFDSCVIAVWGCINTFTEHHWGGPWVKNDLQHTSMGIIWWAAGLVGMFLSRNRDGKPRRNLIPSIVIILTGWGMSSHPQELMISTMIHAVFGYTLMAAGAVRIIEISFVLKDRPFRSKIGGDPQSFQYLTPFLLYASGFLFLGATEEQMALLASANVTHVSYILIIFSISFLLFLFVLVLLQLYASYSVVSKTQSSIGPGATSPQPEYQDLETGDDHAANGSLLGRLGRWGRRKRSDSDDYDEDEDDQTHRKANGRTIPPDEALRVQQAQEFELDALISDDEGEGQTPRKQENGIVHP